MVAIVPRTGLACCAALLAASLYTAPAHAGTASAAVPASAKPSKTLGFAVTSFPYAIYKGANDCPDGMAMAAKEIYLAASTPAERTRLTKPENLKEFEQKAYHTTD